MKTQVAGLTLRAMLAATVGRMLLQKASPFNGRPGDPAPSEEWHDEMNGIVLTTTNFVDVVDENVESRLTWVLAHALWTLRITERRRRHENGSFEKIGPYEVALEGDLVDASRFLGLPKEMFFAALRADSWTLPEITVERLRWLDLPYRYDAGRLNVMRRRL